MPQLLTPRAARVTPAGRRSSVGIAAIAWLVALAVFAGNAPAASPAPIELGRADAFAVLGATTVTSANTSTITGDLGVSPGTAVTGFPPGAGTGVLNGTMHLGDDIAAGAQTDLATAYDAGMLQAATSGAEVLDGLTIGPGVYRSESTLSLAGTLTLDGGGDPNAVFILQADSTLSTAANSAVALVGAAQACNVFWQVGGSAMLGANSSLTGSILALTSITLGAGAAIDGRALARDGAVTMDGNTVSASQCSTDLAVLLEPTFGNFSVTTLNGSAQSRHTTISDWSVNDPRGSALGWYVTMSASPLVTADTTPITMTGATLTVAAPSVAAIGTNASTEPAVQGGDIRAGSVVIADADADTGLGAWSLTHGATDLTLGIPADARAGSYTSTITMTLTPGVGS